MVFGIVVEAERDAAVYSALIKRIRPEVQHVLPKPCYGVAGVRRRFVGWLKHFQWHSGYEIGKALVIRDSDRRDPQAAEEELARILDQSAFQPRLPVHFYATRCMVESWLIADEDAVNQVARARGGTRGTALPVADALETLAAKDRFRRMLSEAGLPDTPTVYHEVAEVADLQRIKQRCPYFARFVECVHGC
jgi:hypothetical protein